MVRLNKANGQSHLKIRIVETIYDVPAQHEELLPLYEQGMEEAESEKQLLVLAGLRTALELLLTNLIIQPLHVCFQSLYEI